MFKQLNYTIILFICEQLNSTSYSLIEFVGAIEFDAKKSQ
jgi:hypothetical protein